MRIGLEDNTSAEFVVLELPLKCHLPERPEYILQTTFC